jgi:uncharacterized protein
MTSQIRFLKSFKDVSAAAWNRVANPNPSTYNPFVSYEFLSALELSGSANSKTGWAASHIVIEDNGAIVAACPCYLKSHSMGEYVFDHGWADAFHRAGGQYYPKLQVSVPFTPATGPRLLAPTDALHEALADALLSLCASNSASSVHVTFASNENSKAFSNSKWLPRNDLQFHWHNANYKTFDDFLNALSSSKRKNIRKERESVKSVGTSFMHLTGDALLPKHWDFFYEFYIDTGNRKWGQPYLTRKFFTLLQETMREKILLILAMRNGAIIAGALNFIGGNTLYGRNWGCLENQPFLHFETCYYQAIDFAIAHGLQTVEAGAQGEHKLARGYVPVKTQSYHHLAHPGLSRAVADYLEHERQAISENQTELAAHAPFKHEQD